MSSFHPTLRPAILAALLALLSVGGTPGRAQEDAGKPAADAAPKVKPKPKPPAPKPTPKAAPAPAAAAPAAPAMPAAVWPAGANSISERYDEWTMTCSRADAMAVAKTDAKASCTLVQSQGDNKTGRRQFAFELRTPKDGRAEGLILMPFGLAIEPGVTFKLDDAVLGKGAPYVSCGNEGCLVPISFPTLATDAMRTAKTLVVISQKNGNNEPQSITVPLGGFSAVWDRAIAFAS